MVQIGEAFDYIQNGANIKQGVVDGGIPITRIETISNNQFNRDRMGYAGITDVQKYKSYVLEDEDILMSHINSLSYLGRAVLYKKQADETIIHGMNLLRLKANREIVLPAYACYFFQTEFFKEQINRIAKKSVNQASFSVADLKKSVVPVVSLEEQKQIVSRLDKIDFLISLRKKQLQKLDDLVKSRFVEMFGDSATNHQKWELVPLDSLTDVGSSKRIFEKEYVNSGVPFYRTKEIVKLASGKAVSSELYISNERFAEIKNQYGVPKSGDLLISAVGTIGIIWIVDGKREFYYKDGNLLRVGVSDKFNSIYMKYLLESLIAEYKYRMSVGTAYAALTISGLSKIKVPNAPIHLQNVFSQYVVKVTESKLTVQQGLDKLELLKQSLMQKYFG